ncbi:MAG: 23S rRNA (uracil(1939)-C(5))-methyltransferase RlmD [Endomicrobium sp.]|jgi:23S rRNA (uracil-5-)-methyltransferase RumA|nr:23S rRNA (uracil(1939)-C(5))-methyltransferase RlmD [Endomicrobium sp.]
MSLKNTIISVKAEKIVFPGRTLCRCEDGTALFTEGLLPGETGEVFVIKDKKSFREGILKNISENSLERITPECPSFGRCGGCSFQNADYKSQLKYKSLCVDELLSFTGVRINEILPSPEIWHYRNKMEFSFFNCDGKTDLGLHIRGSYNRYSSVPPCFIADEDFLKAAKAAKDFANKSGLSAYDNATHEGFFRHLVLRKAKNNNQTLINIVTNSQNKDRSFWESFIDETKSFADGVCWTKNAKISDAVRVDAFSVLYGKERIVEKLNVGGKDYFFNISPFSFFQTNSKGAQVLYNEILRLLNPAKTCVLLDLYCGTGAIGISLAHTVKEVVGIEQVEQAVEDAKENALLNGVENASFFALTAETWAQQNSKKFDAAIVDPPRNGLAKNIIKFLLNCGAGKIVYVSCNPSTLARDLSLIVESGKYKIKEIVPADMFPHTHHIEIITLLERQL